MDKEKKEREKLLARTAALYENEDENYAAELQVKGYGLRDLI